MGKQVAAIVRNYDAPTKMLFYAFRTRGEKLVDVDDDEGKSL